MKYNVHIYVGARVRLEGIEADSQQAAVDKAILDYDPSSFFSGDDSSEAAVPDESILGALVDEEGDDEFERTKYYPTGDAAVYLEGPDGLDHCLPIEAKSPDALLAIFKKIAALPTHPAHDARNYACLNRARSLASLAVTLAESAAPANAAKVPS